MAGHPIVSEVRELEGPSEAPSTPLAPRRAPPPSTQALKGCRPCSAGTQAVSFAFCSRREAVTDGVRVKSRIWATDSSQEGGVVLCPTSSLRGRSSQDKIAPVGLWDIRARLKRSFLVIQLETSNEASTQGACQPSCRRPARRARSSPQPPHQMPPLAQGPKPRVPQV